MSAPRGKDCNQGRNAVVVATYQLARLDDVIADCPDRREHSQSVVNDVPRKGNGASPGWGRAAGRWVRGKARRAQYQYLRRHPETVRHLRGGDDRGRAGCVAAAAR